MPNPWPLDHPSRSALAAASAKREAPNGLKGLGFFSQPAPRQVLHDWLRNEVETRLEAIERKLEEVLELQRTSLGAPRREVSEPLPPYSPKHLPLSASPTHAPPRSEVIPVQDCEVRETGIAASRHSEWEVQWVEPPAVVEHVVTADSDMTMGNTTGGLHKVSEHLHSLVKLSSWMHEKRSGRLEIFERIRQFLEDPESSLAAKRYDQMMPFVIILTVAVTVCQQMDNPIINNVTACVLEVCIEVLFGVEVIIWFFVSPMKWAFLHNIYTIIDICSVLPLALRSGMGLVIDVHHKDRNDLAIPVLLGFVPVIRLLKVLRRFQKFHLLLKAFSLALEAMPVFLFIYISLMFVFTTLIYIVEPARNIGTLPQAAWLAMESMTTVGYGDVAPVSTLGRFVTATLVSITNLYMAIPLGIIGGAFSEVWADRDRILLAEKARVKLLQNGFTEQDFAKVVKIFDTDNNGVLDQREFEAMVTEMNLGLTRDRIVELFRLADKDGSGEVDSNELLAMIFRYDSVAKREIALRNSVSFRDPPPVVRRASSKESDLAK